MNTTGIIYMAFGQSSANAVSNSLRSIRKIGINIPAVVVGTHPVEGTEFLGWRGHPPWIEDPEDPDQRFRAGYVKPFLQPISPFDYTLYLDADTEIRKSFMEGFKYLDENDICAVHHEGWQQHTMGAIKSHINKPSFSIPYYRDIRRELDYTISVIGKDKTIVNSGVIFFKKSYEASMLFAEWYLEWLRFSGWEEQLALLRAEHKCKNLKIKHLPVTWNQKHLYADTIIWHKMGKGEARDQKEHS